MTHEADSVQLVVFDLHVNIYLLITFLVAMIALLNPSNISLAGAIMSWSLLFALLKHHTEHHPTGLIAQWLEKL